MIVHVDRVEMMSAIDRLVAVTTTTIEVIVFVIDLVVEVIVLECYSIPCPFDFQRNQTSGR